MTQDDFELLEALPRLRKDAARWQWFRSIACMSDREAQDAAIEALGNACPEPTTPEEVDRAVDTVMGALAKVRCDGNHGGPRCADPECWNDDAGVQVAQAPGKPMQGLADWLRAVAETQAKDAEQEACMRQWAREVDAARGVTGTFNDQQETPR